MSRTKLRRFEEGLFNTGVGVVAALAQSKWLRPLLGPVVRGLARGVRCYRGARRGPLDAKALGQEWQRLMPNPKVMPIVGQDAQTAYGEIHVHCPLRGTGDVNACYRMMEYDRALLAPAGGRLVVLRSQAEPGVNVCRVAIRPASLPADDLIPAHRASRSLNVPSPGKC